MTEDTELAPELAAALRRYLEIQRDEQRLQEEKETLRETIGGFMTQRRLEWWYPEVDGQPLKVRFHESAAFEYDEAILRDRLGERYAVILAPDLRKIRRCLPEIGPALAPLMDKIGSPSPDKIRAAIEQGTVRREEFTGAFKKTTKRLVAVMRKRSGGAAEPMPDDPD